MRKEKNNHGKWWLPNALGKMYHGRLTYDNETGCDLEIEEAFPGFEEGSGDAPEFILGRTGDGTEYTLIGNSWRGISHTLGKSMLDKHPTKSQFHSRYLLEGKHLQGHSEFVIEEAKVSFSYLNQWMWESNIKKSEFSNGLIEWQNVEPELIAKIPGCNIQKELIVNETHYNRPQKGYKVINEWYINFQYDTPVTIEIVWETIRKFQRLIAFSSQRPILIRELLVKFPNSKSIYPLWLKQPLKESGEEDFLGALDYLFRYIDYSHHMPMIIQKWYDIYDNFGAIMDSYLSIFYSEIVFTEAEFLTYAQCLEAFHRGMEKLEVIPTNIADDIRAKMLTMVPADHLEFIEGKLSHIHEPSFLNRLQDMYKKVFAPLSATSIRIDDDQFRKIRNTRNFYTHFDRRLRDKILKGNDLYSANRALNFVLIIYILKQLNFNTPEIASQLKRIR